VNARSFININKRAELEFFIQDKQLDILAITETWANEKILNSELNIEGYGMYRKDRQEVKEAKGGGVIIYVTTRLHSSPNEELIKLKCESLWIKLSTGKKYILNFGVCYKSPTAQHHEMENMFSAIQIASKQQAIIVGDFNYPDINWETLEHSSDAEQFVDLIQDCYLCQHVDMPTRDKNCLDLVFTTEQSMVENLRVVEHFSTSDHNIVTWDLLTDIEVNESVGYKYCFYKADYSHMSTFLADQDWKLLFDNKKK
jgi:hypothetical protein